MLSLDLTVSRPELTSRLHSASSGRSGVVIIGVVIVLLTNLLVTTPSAYGRGSQLSLCVGA